MRYFSYIWQRNIKCNPYEEPTWFCMLISVFVFMCLVWEQSTRVSQWHHFAYRFVSIEPGKASRRCLDSGRWSNRDPADLGRQQGWTNYSTCLQDEVVKIMSRLTPGDLKVTRPHKSTMLETTPEPSVLFYYSSSPINICGFSLMFDMKNHRIFVFYFSNYSSLFNV